MVFFVCSNCNESMKKNKVEQHRNNNCRKNAVFSCVDCSKEFQGDEYKQHVGCISEAEKYGGSQGKGTDKKHKKQHDWMETVKAAEASVKTSDPKLKGLLKALLDQPTLPQKKPKFINFLKSVFRRKYGDNLALYNEAWRIIENSKTNQNTEVTADQENKPSEPVVESKMKKKAPKRRADTEMEVDDKEVTAVRDAKRKKREEKANPLKEDTVKLNDTLQESNTNQKPFNWKTVVMKSVKKKGKISLSLLRKRAAAEYLSSGRPALPETRIWKILDKKLKALDNIVVDGDKVTLKVAK